MHGRRAWLHAAAASAAGVAASAVLARSEAVEGRVWHVAPGDSLARVLDAAQDGDTVELAAGVHRGQVGSIRQRRLVLRGSADGGTWLDAAGAHAEGKAILVVRDGDVRIDDLGFRGARVPDGNGAGIRFERGRLTLRRCRFVDNEMGLLSANFVGAALRIEDSLFADAPPVPPGHGLTHLLYVGRIARLELVRTAFARGRHGHLLKSRAAVSVVDDCRFAGAGDGGSASYELDFPNGGDVAVRGCDIVQTAASPNRTMVAFGAEGEFRGGADAPRRHRLVLAGNRFSSHGARGIAVQVHRGRLQGEVDVEARDNVYRGRLAVAAPFADPAQGNRVESAALGE